MNAQNMLAGAAGQEGKSTARADGITVDVDAKWLYRAGGIAAFVLVVVYLLTFPVYAWVGDAPPDDVAARVAYFAEHAAGWWTILGLMVFSDLLLIPIFLALYQALKNVNRTIMLVALAFAGLFIVLDLAVTWTTFSALIISGSAYAAAVTDAQKAALVAAAGYASAMMDSPLGGAYSILFPSMGILLTGLVMRKGGPFNTITIYLALVTGITGIIFMGSYVTDTLYVVRIINALLGTAWFLLVGKGLCRITR